MDTERAGMNAVGPSLRRRAKWRPSPGRAALSFAVLRKGCVSQLRLIGWNAVWLIVGLTLIAAAGEIWFRLTVPFATNVHPSQFVPGVGKIGKPLAEFRHTNHVDVWTVSRTNSLGFLDREPIGVEQASESCHITMIGDSFVEGREVSIPDKFHVRLEALAARERPELNVTTSAFGRAGTAQVNQLPFYDEFARHLHPNKVVLVFVRNDFKENEIREAVDSFVTVKKSGDGALTLQPPSPGYDRAEVETQIRFVRRVVRLGRSNPFLKPKIERLMNVAKMSYFAQWLDAKLDAMWGMWGWAAGRRARRTERDVPLEGTAFALDLFKERTDRDGASLVILATQTMRSRGGGYVFNRLSALAEERDIPVIDQYDYIIRQGGRIEDAHWSHDEHWNVTGHRWAAEALFEYLKQHPETCGGGVAGRAHRGAS